MVAEAFTEQPANFIVERLELAPEQLLLDLCCGRGRHAPALARRGIEVDLIHGDFQGAARSMDGTRLIMIAHRQGNSIPSADMP